MSAGTSFRSLPRSRRALGALLATAAVLGLVPLVQAQARSSAPDRPRLEADPRAPEPTELPDDARWGEFVEATDTVLRLAQPDGTELRATMTEAAVGGALEVDGYSIVKGDDGWWRYASKRGAQGLEASDARAGVDARPDSLTPGVGRVRDVWTRDDGSDVRTELLRQLQIASRQASAQAAAAGEPRVFRFPVVLFATQWDEAQGQTAPQFQEGNDVAHYEAILDGFGGNPTGTLTEFYFENSHGQFLVQVDVLAQPNGQPYSSKLSIPDRCYWGGIDPPEDPLDDYDLLDNVIGAGGGGALGMAIELMYTTTLALDHQFAEYDNDGDLSIDFMGIIHSGPEMAVSGDPCDTWSHAIAVSSFAGVATNLLELVTTTLGVPAPDISTANLKLGLPVPGQLVTFDRLFTMPEFETRDSVLTIGVAAHEMAHALGESDFYGTSGLTSGSGDWDVMSGGSYGGSPSGSNPTWFNPESRIFQGWTTPTIVHEDELDYTFRRRSSMPFEGYTYDQPNPNLVLVPTRWVKVGDTTDEGTPAEHTWTETDVYGLPLDGDEGYVIEGWYLEFASRMPVKGPGIHPEMGRESYFDRWLYGSGLLTWHFDYWQRSNVRYGDNGGNDDPNRMQMDVEEWDFNDATQEIALNRNRAEASDVAWDAATGITSGTHERNAFNTGEGNTPGDPQEPIEFDSTGELITPLTPFRYEFTVTDDPDNQVMRVAINSELIGDCTLQLFLKDESGEIPKTEVIDSGSFGTAEEAIIVKPTPGDWIVEVGDYAACASAAGTITFESPTTFDTTGTADTWRNHDVAPSGWAFTNIRTGGSDGLSHGADAGGPDEITVDIQNFEDDLDYSPGVIRGANNGPEQGREGLNAGRANPLVLPVFSNGLGDGFEDVHVVDVEIREGSVSGPPVASGTVELGSYERADFSFEYDPGAEGPLDLVAIVDPEAEIEEGSEANNVQRSTLWAGPEDPSVLIVDDDGSGDTEMVYAGALAALGIPYAIVENSASAEQMHGYDAVIWVSTLDRGPGQLDERDRSEIAAVLGSRDGANVWLSSNRAIEALTLTESVDWGEQWFGVASIDIDSFYDTVQMETEDILGDGTIDIDVLPGRPFVDKYVLADTEAVTSLGVLQGSGRTGPAGDGEAILGARVEGDGFRTVVNSFSLSQLRDPQDAIAFVESVMDHFGVAGSQYTVESEDPIVYHWQPRQTVPNVDLPVKAIVLGGTPPYPITLFYRHHSIGDFVSVPMTSTGSAGGFTGIIPAADVTPDGLDYYLKAGSASTFVPRAAESRSVQNAIAVFLPDAQVDPPDPSDTPDPSDSPDPSDTPEEPDDPDTPDSPDDPDAPTAPDDPDVGAGGEERIPATGAEIPVLAAGLLLLAALGVRRLVQRA